MLSCCVCKASQQGTHAKETPMEQGVEPDASLMHLCVQDAASSHAHHIAMYLAALSIIRKGSMSSPHSHVFGAAGLLRAG